MLGMKNLTIGSLFSGIGGLECGLEQAGVGRSVWHVEQSAYCQSILRKHWPDSTLHDDVTTVGRHNLNRVDVLCGGFPCQDLSTARPNGAGLDGKRSGLWFEMERVIGELLPAAVLVENVHHSWRRWLPVVRSRLWSLGYPTVPLRVRASDLGAWHERSRIFLIGWRTAHLDDQGQLQQPRVQPQSWGRIAHSLVPEVAHAHRQWVWEQSGRGSNEPDPNAAVFGQSVSGRRPGPIKAGRAEAYRPAADVDQEVPASTGSGLLAAWPGARPTSPIVVRGLHGLPRGLDPASRKQRVSALGNSVVVPCSWLVGRVMMECLL